MLATLTIEFILAAYAIWRYKLDTIGKLAVSILLSLAVFQVAEYYVCTGHGLSAMQWSKLGYASITLLPALGLHAMYVLAKKPVGKLVWAAYGTMAACVGYFLTYHSAFIGYQCTGNYVIFQIGFRPALVYAVYYYGWLTTGIILGVQWISELQNRVKKPSISHITSKQSLQGLVLGYLIFIVPTALANSVKPETRSGIPSIMCGFAVIFALILALYILPRAGTRKSLTLSQQLIDKPSTV